MINLGLFLTIFYKLNFHNMLNSFSGYMHIGIKTEDPDLTK